MRLLATLPILAFDYSEYFLSYIDRPIYLSQTIKNQICIVFASENSKRLVDLLWLARLAGIGWWLFGAWVIFHWCKDLHGTRAAYVGLALWCFEPTVLAYEPLVTTDLASAVTILATSYAFWRYFQHPSWEMAFVTGVLLGIAELTEYSALILYALWPTLAVVDRLARDSHQKQDRRVLQRMAHATCTLLLSLGIINVGYFASDSGQSLGEHEFISRTLGGNARSPSPLHDNLPVGNRFRNFKIEALPLPLPSDYLSGIDLRCWTAEQRVSTLITVVATTATSTQSSGLITLALRLPLGLLVMTIWSVVLVLYRRRKHPSLREDLFWLTPLVFCGSVASDGVIVPSPGRILLVVPYLIFGASKLTTYLRPEYRNLGGFVLALFVWTMSSGVASFPETLCYRNEFAGRPSRSSTLVATPQGDGDGGHELLRLREWDRRHMEVNAMRVVVNSPVDPRDHGFPNSPPPFDPRSPALKIIDPPPEIGPVPGYFAIDRSKLSTNDFRYFSNFKPIETIGTSLLIYRITQDGVDKVRSQSEYLKSVDRQQKYVRTLSGGVPKDSAFRFFVSQGRYGRKMNYAVYIPSTYDGITPHPLILFLHGSGDAGSMGRQYLNVGLPRVIEQRRDSFGFIVLCPQGHDGQWEDKSDDVEQTMTILADVQRLFKVDSRRISLTGVSKGGTATFEFAARHPNRWAAIVPVSSAPDADQARALRDIPCWCFHNCNDESGHFHQYQTEGSPVELPRRMIQAMKAAGGKPRYTEFLHIGDAHNAWDQAYNMPELYEWLSKQKNSDTNIDALGVGELKIK